MYKYHFVAKAVEHGAECCETCSQQMLSGTAKMACSFPRMLRTAEAEAAALEAGRVRTGRMSGACARVNIARCDHRASKGSKAELVSQGFKADSE